MSKPRTLCALTALWAPSRMAATPHSVRLELAGAGMAMLWLPAAPPRPTCSARLLSSAPVGVQGGGACWRWRCWRRGWDWLCRDCGPAVRLMRGAGALQEARRRTALHCSCAACAWGTYSQCNSCRGHRPRRCPLEYCVVIEMYSYPNLPIVLPFNNIGQRPRHSSCRNTVIFCWFWAGLASVPSPGS